MRGGVDDRITSDFAELTRRAVAGDCDGWLQTPRGRLALIVVLDQFPRSLWRGTPQAWASDPRALAIALEGFDNGHFDALETVWEKAFFQMPLGHCEGPDLLERIERAVQIADQLLDECPPHLRPLYAFNAQQPREHRKVIAAFGRHPHRNDVLGRPSTPEEEAYLARGAFPHERVGAGLTGEASS